MRDIEGVAHVNARNQHDLFFLQGWIHADDRLFQMDLTRRQASGTLAELLGQSALAGDVQVRTIGLRRAAERSLPLQSVQTRAALQAYADGVNAWLVRNQPPRATIFAVWRGQYIGNVIDERLAPLDVPLPGGPDSVKTLKRLLNTFDSRRGVGVSGLDFYAVPGVTDAADRRDVLLLQSLADALDRLAGDPFAAAFHRSTDQDAYRWGKLHRIVFDGLPVPAVYSVPTANRPFPQPLAGLPGIPTDGGFQAVDASSHNPRAASVNDFMFVAGPTSRYVGQGTPLGMRGRTSLPGGTSERVGDRFRLNLLGGWLTNDTFPSRLYPSDLAGATGLTCRAPVRVRQRFRAAPPSCRRPRCGPRSGGNHGSRPTAPARRPAPPAGHRRRSR